jgi:hypothetical protein
MEVEHELRSVCKIEASWKALSEHTISVGKGKVHTVTGQRRLGKEVEVYLNCIFNLGARWGGWSTPRPGRFTPGKDPEPIVWEVGWAPEPVWSGAENLALTGIRSR